MEAKEPRLVDLYLMGYEQGRRAGLEDAVNRLGEKSAYYMELSNGARAIEDWKSQLQWGTSANIIANAQDEIRALLDKEKTDGG